MIDETIQGAKISSNCHGEDNVVNIILNFFETNEIFVICVPIILLPLVTLKKEKEVAMETVLMFQVIAIFLLKMIRILVCVLHNSCLCI